MRTAALLWHMCDEQQGPRDSQHDTTGPSLAPLSGGRGGRVGVQVTTRPKSMRATRQLLLPPKYRRFNLTTLQYFRVHGRVLPRGRLVEAASLPCHARHAAVTVPPEPCRGWLRCGEARYRAVSQCERPLCHCIQVCGAGTPKYRTLMAYSDYLSILSYCLNRFVTYSRLS
jgi:hypothetical protein